LTEPKKDSKEFEQPKADLSPPKTLNEDKAIRASTKTLAAKKPLPVFLESSKPKYSKTVKPKVGKKSIKKSTKESMLGKCNRFSK
jgi:hypothetical protein